MGNKNNKTNEQSVALATPGEAVFESLLKLDHVQLENLYRTSTDKNIRDILDDNFFWEQKFKQISYNFPTLDGDVKQLADIYFFTIKGHYQEAVKLLQGMNATIYVKWANAYLMENQLNGDFNHDVDIMIKYKAAEMYDADLNQLCESNKYAKQVCDYDDTLWNTKIQKYFPDFPELYLDDIHSGDAGGSLKRVYSLLLKRNDDEVRKIIEMNSYRPDIDLSNYESWLVQQKLLIQRREVPKATEASVDCLNGYNIMESIGRGTYGEVFTACKPDCIYAIKKISRDFDINEIDIGHFMGEEGIGPKLYSYWFCEQDQTWYIVNEKINGITLDQYNNCISQELYNLIRAKINKMHSLGVIHYDLHAGNIILVTEGNHIVDIYIIDYGRAKYIYDEQGNLAIDPSHIMVDDKALEYISLCYSVTIGI